MNNHTQSYDRCLKKGIIKYVSCDYEKVQVWIDLHG